MKTYIPIGQLIQDLERAYVAATNARKLAHILVCKVQKRKTPNPDKLAAARKQKSRTCANWNRIRAELKRYQKIAQTEFSLICYGGAIIWKYKEKYRLFSHPHSLWPSEFDIKFASKCHKSD